MIILSTVSGSEDVLPTKSSSGHCSSSEGLHSAIPVLSSWNCRRELSIQSHTTQRYTGSRVDVSVIFVAPPSSRLHVSFDLAIFIFSIRCFPVLCSFSLLSRTRTFDGDRFSTCFLKMD